MLVAINIKTDSACSARGKSRQRGPTVPAFQRRGRGEAAWVVGQGEGGGEEGGLTHVLAAAVQPEAAQHRPQLGHRPLAEARVPHVLLLALRRSRVRRVGHREIATEGFFALARGPALNLFE
jgi:hypothetical protein